MTITVENKYGSYVPDEPYFIDQYGVMESNKYGVLVDPEVASFLLLESGGFLLQEDGGFIELE